MSQKRTILAGLRLLVSLLVGVAPGFIMGVILGVSYHPWSFERQQVYFFVFLITGGLAAALCPLAVGVAVFRKCLKWCSVGLIGGGVESALAGAVRWWVDPPAVFAAAFVWWGIIFGTWCGWLQGNPRAGALSGLILAGLLAGMAFFVAHPDPLAVFGGLIGLLAGTLIYQGRKKLFVWGARLTVAGMVIASAAVICAFRQTYWTPTKVFRVIDSGRTGRHHAYFDPIYSETVLSSHGDGVCIWRVRDGSVRSKIPRRSNSGDITWQTKDDPVYVEVSSSGRVRKWDVFLGELLAETIIPDFAANPPFERQLNEYVNPYKLVLSRNGRLAAILVPNENRIALVDFESRNVEVTSINDLPPLSALALSSDGRKLLLGASNQQSMFLCDCTRGTPRLMQTYPEVFPPRGEMVFSSDNRRACIFGGQLDPGVLRIVDLERNKLVLDVPGLTQRVDNVAFSIDGRRLLTVERRNILRLWDATTGTEQRCFRQHRSWILNTFFGGGMSSIDVVAIAPNGALGLATCSDGTVSVWRLPDPYLNRGRGGD
jgi:hypothetical protein